MSRPAPRASSRASSTPARRAAPRVAIPIRAPASARRAGQAPNSAVRSQFSVPVNGIASTGAIPDGNLAYTFAPSTQDWWAQACQLYNKFRITNLRVSFQPGLSAFATGQYALVADSDPVRRVASFESVANGFRALRKPIRNPGSLIVHPTQLHRLPWYYTDGDRATDGNTQLIVYLAWAGVTTGTSLDGSVAIGSLSFEFDLELSEASSIGPHIANMGVIRGGVAGQSVALPFGTDYRVAGLFYPQMVAGVIHFSGLAVGSYYSISFSCDGNLTGVTAVMTGVTQRNEGGAGVNAGVSAHYDAYFRADSPDITIDLTLAGTTVSYPIISLAPLPAGVF